MLDFVWRYGLLGYSRAWRMEERPGARLREGGHGQGDPTIHGDPVPWVLAHAQTVRLLLDLMGRLDEHAALRGFLETLEVQREGQADAYVYRAAHRGYLDPKEWHSARRDRQPRDVALHFIENILNQNLTGVSRASIVEPQDNGHQGLTSLFEPRNLLDAIYWQLADAAAIGNRVRRCANTTIRGVLRRSRQEGQVLPAAKGLLQRLR